MKIELHSAIAELTESDFRHPGLRKARFIFCDNLPNENGQGIKREEFAQVMKSAIGAPVKMKFLGETVSGHYGSIPIGYIHRMEEKVVDEEKGVYQLIADATIFASEYPDEVTWLEEKLAEATAGNGEAPGLSWELSYKNEEVEGPITWLKNILTSAATFVRHPAYGTRTALLALASDQSIDFGNKVEVIQTLNAFAEEFGPKNQDKGGNNIVNEELEKAKKEIEELNKKIAALEAQASTASTDNVSLTADNESLKEALAQKEATIAEYEKKALVEARTKEITEAGLKISDLDDEKLAKKQAFWTSLSEESFAEYVDELKSAMKDKKASASLLPKTPLPRVVTADADNASVSELKGRFASFRNSTSQQPE